MSGHIMWNLLNEPSGSLIKFIENDHECKILFIIWPFNIGFYHLINAQYFKKETHYWHGRCQWRYVYVPMCYYTCGHTIFMTRRYPLNNNDVMWKK